MDSVDFDVYFVAFYKHERPQQLAAGPFVDLDDAMDKVDLLEGNSRSSYCVVKTTLPFTLV